MACLRVTSFVDCVSSDNYNVFDDTHLIFSIFLIMTIVCPECKNELALEEKEYQVGDIIECTFCGSELEVSDVKADGAVVVVLVEEEK